MPTIKVEDFQNDPDYLIEKVVMDNIPNLGDPSGKEFLQDFESALSECQKALNKGYHLTDFWSHQDTGVEFIFKKKKEQED
ncbi:hypothetical protein JCM14036_04780 [Desulfotomaculum defluvii]